jgi:hypothetical protein
MLTSPTGAARMLVATLLRECVIQPSEWPQPSVAPSA